MNVNTRRRETVAKWRTKHTHQWRQIEECTSFPTVYAVLFDEALGIVVAVRSSSILKGQIGIVKIVLKVAHSHFRNLRNSDILRTYYLTEKNNRQWNYLTFPSLRLPPDTWQVEWNNCLNGSLHHGASTSFFVRNQHHSPICKIPNRSPLHWESKIVPSKFRWTFRALFGGLIRLTSGPSGRQTHSRVFDVDLLAVADSSFSMKRNAQLRLTFERYCEDAFHQTILSNNSIQYTKRRKGCTLRWYLTWHSGVKQYQYLVSIHCR